MACEPVYPFHCLPVFFYIGQDIVPALPFAFFVKYIGHTAFCSPEGAEWINISCMNTFGAL